MVINPYKMRTMTNNKILKSMAALVFVGAMTAGCSSDDLTAETPQPADAGKTVVMKITISLSESASTRALTEAGVKTFAMGDQIAVIYKNTAGETVKVESAALLGTDLHDAGQNATFSVVLTNPEPSTAVRYIYPASMAAAAVATDVATNDDATINYAALATQDGTLATIASTLDLAVFDGTLTDQAALPPATLENPLTIGKFTIKNSATDDDITSTVTNLTINDGTNTYTVHRTAAAGPIYVAMKPIASTQTVTVNAITDNNKYIKSVTGNTLAQNTMYPINVSMTARYPLAMANATQIDMGCLIGQDGNIYMSAAGITAAGTGTTPVAVIAYVGTDNFTENGTSVKAVGAASASVFAGHGLALCLKNAASDIAWTTEEVLKFPGQEVTDAAGLTRSTNVSGYTNTKTLKDEATKYPAAAAAWNYTGLTAPNGTTGWFLPTAQQWVRMQTGLGGLSESDIVWDEAFDNTRTAVNKWETALAKAGAAGTAYDSMTSNNLTYYSSSEYSNNLNVCLYIWDTFLWTWTNKEFNGYGNCVRPILAF